MEERFEMGQDSKVWYNKAKESLNSKGPMQKNRREMLFESSNHMTTFLLAGRTQVAIISKRVWGGLSEINCAAQNGKRE